MRFAYLTTDEVNQALAAEMAADAGVSVYPFTPKDGAAYTGFEAVICDWDSWPREGQVAFLTMLKRGALPGRLGVHGYNLSAQEITMFLKRGVVVHRLLKTEIFRLLREPATLAASAPQLDGKAHYERDSKEPARNAETPCDSVVPISKAVTVPS